MLPIARILFSASACAVVIVAAAPAPADESGLGRLEVDRQGRLVLAVDADHDGVTDVAYVADPAPPEDLLRGLAPRSGPFHVRLDGRCLIVRDLERGTTLAVSTQDPRECPADADGAGLRVVRAGTTGIARSTDPEWIASPDRFDASGIVVLADPNLPDYIRCAPGRCEVTYDSDCQVGGPGATRASVDCGAGSLLGGSINGQSHAVVCGPSHYACGRCEGPVAYARCHPRNCYDRVPGVYYNCDPDKPKEPVAP